MSVYQKTVTHAPATVNSSSNQQDDDDWDTDADYVNDVSEKEQRFGSKLIKPEEVGEDMASLREKTYARHDASVKQEYDSKKMLYGGDRAANNVKH